MQDYRDRGVQWERGSKVGNGWSCMRGWMDGRMERWMEGWGDICMDGWMDEGMDGWMDEGMGLELDGWLNGWIDGWEDVGCIFSELIDGFVQYDAHFREWIDGAIQYIGIHQYNTNFIEWIISFISDVSHACMYNCPCCANYVIIDLQLLPIDDAPTTENTIVRICNLQTEPCKSCIGLFSPNEVLELWMGSLLFGWAGDKCPTLCKCAIKCSTNPLKVGGGVRVVLRAVRDRVRQRVRRQQDQQQAREAWSAPGHSPHVSHRVSEPRHDDGGLGQGALLPLADHHLPSQPWRHDRRRVPHNL